MKSLLLASRPTSRLLSRTEQQSQWPPRILGNASASSLLYIRSTTLTRRLLSSKVQVDHHTHSNSNISKNKKKARSIPQDGFSLADFVSGTASASASTVLSPSNINSNINSNSNSNSKINKSFHIKTYGCQMNVNDTDIVRAILIEHGYQPAVDEASADIWLTNTCAIRDKAEQKVWQRLRLLKKTKSKAKSHQVVGLLGCMAERLQHEILKDNMADVVVGPDAYRDLPRLLGTLFPKEEEEDHYVRQQAINVELSLDETYSDITPVRDDYHSHSAFVSIQRGCSNRCSFCIVPFTRGQERSRPLESIVQEIQHLVDSGGVKEVVLLGQNVNSYHDRSDAALLVNPTAMTLGLSNTGFRNRVHRPTTQGGYPFCDLVDAVSMISPELRVRFTSPHPKDYPFELLQLMAERPNVCNQLHMPAQSGSTSMLQRMKRGYTREAYLELMETVHSVIPDVALSSDFIAGFCQETDEEHADTVSLLEQVQYDQAFLFAYSMREKTYAHRRLQDNVPPEVKKARLQELIDTYRTTVHAKNERVEIGKLRLVLIEGASKRNMQEGQVTWSGRTDQNKRILFNVTPVQEQETAVQAMDGEWMTTFLRQGSFLHSQNDASLYAAGPPGMTTSLVPGDYAVVQVTEAKGHTLRGRLLWKTSLAKFAEVESNVISKLDDYELTRLKESLLGADNATA
jgi:MiaB/RimO family radical SAM methylthiotransferase